MVGPGLGDGRRKANERMTRRRRQAGLSAGASGAVCEAWGVGNGAALGGLGYWVGERQTWTELLEAGAGPSEKG